MGITYNQLLPVILWEGRLYGLSRVISRLFLPPHTLASLPAGPPPKLKKFEAHPQQPAAHSSPHTITIRQQHSQQQTTTADHIMSAQHPINVSSTLATEPDGLEGREALKSVAVYDHTAVDAEWQGYGHVQALREEVCWPDRADISSLRMETQLPRRQVHQSNT